MKLIYKWDSQSIFSGTKLVEDDYQPQAGETFAAIPQPNLIPVKWTGSAWQSATQEEHDAYFKQQQALYLQQHPEAARQQGPTDQQKLNATTSLQLAQLLADSKKQDKLNAQLTIDLASLKQQLQQKNDTKAQATA
jgi:hypothetical protein